MLFQMVCMEYESDCESENSYEMSMTLTSGISKTTFVIFHLFFPKVTLISISNFPKFQFGISMGSRDSGFYVGGLL